MSSLIPRPGFVPGTPDPAQWVQVQELPARHGSPEAAGDADQLDLGEVWRTLVRRRRWVAVTAAVVLGLAALRTTYQRLLEPVYQGSFSLLISDPINNAGQGRGGEALEGGVFEDLARNTTKADIPTLIELLRSPVLLQPIAARHGLSSDALAARITITTGGERQSKAEGVLHVSLRGNDPQEDGRLLTSLADAYLQAALDQRQQRLNDGINFLDRQAPQLQQRSAVLQQQLAAFRERHNLLEPSEEGAAMRELVQQQNAQIRQLAAERNRLQAARRAIATGTITARGFQEAISTGGESGGAGTGSGGGLSVVDANQSLLEQLTKLDEELADARARFTPGSSIVRGLEARRQQLLPLLRRNQLEAVDSALSLNASRQATAQRQQRELTAAFQLTPQLIRQYEELQQNLEIANENLASFLKTRETFKLELAQRSLPWRVIAPPTINPTPVSPSVPRDLAQGALLGLVVGAGVGLLRDRLDHVFHNPAEVREALQQPLLGHIPYVAFFEGVRTDKRLLLEELDRSTAASPVPGKITGYQRFFYQEAFRNLYTSLRFLNSDKALRSVALTSSMPAEGKSLVNVLLAKTLAEMGHRVLLVDADLRKPQLHHRLGLNNLVGLSNLLTENELRWPEVIQTVPGHEGWTVLTAGLRPPDPARLLSSARMAQLASELVASDAFDLILYDTPPVLGLADAALLAEHLDGLLLLVSLNQVDRSMPKEAVARIQSSAAPLLGVITNTTKKDSASDGPGYSYGYGKYGYNYKYGPYSTTGTYSYYAQPGDGTTRVDSLPPAARSAPGGGTALEPTRRLWRRFSRWIDG